MMNRIGATFRNHILNIKGRSLDRKVIVFESDDWGTIRMPSRQAYASLKRKGIDLDKNPYNRVDSLESAEDVSALAEVLTSFKDHRGNHPVFTANFILANPDFEKVQRSNFSEYSFERFVDTYKRTQNTQHSWSALEEAMANKVFHPQFHGREHVNALAWLKLLREGEENMLNAFDEGTFCIDIPVKNQRRGNLMASLDFNNDSEKSFCRQQLTEGTNLFREIFGFSSESFIAPANVWDDETERVLNTSGIRFFQGFRKQLVPKPEVGGYEGRVHSTGEFSSAGQMYLVRNAYFEPATLEQYDWVGNCLKKIQAAFFWNKPAIISTHRLNYIGSIFPENRNENLKKLKQLLNGILSNWPAAEFLSSDQLGNLYRKGK